MVLSKIEEVKCYLKHSLCKDNRLPQTFIALINDEPVGMYQISMSDDLVESRPDIYPWLVNVYVDEKRRGNGIFYKKIDCQNKFNFLMKTYTIIKY